MDVEGHEEAVIEGAKELLASLRPFVIFEYAYVPDIYAPNSIQLMEGCGYHCYDFATDQRIFPGSLSQGTDLFAIPIEREEEVKDILPQLH